MMLRRRSAIARFNQVQGVTDNEREEARTRLRAAAHTFNVELHESDWHEVGLGQKSKR